MVYTIKYKGEGRTNQTILRVCTLEEECYKQMSNGELHARRNCEYWPTCKSQRHAELIAYRPVLCNGTKVPRIICRWATDHWIPRFTGSLPASASAKARAAAESRTGAAHAAQLFNNVARREYICEYLSKYRVTHRDERREYARRYYNSNKKST